MSTELKPHISINIPVGELKKVLDWCETCIGSRYRFAEDHNSTFYDSWVFMFEHEEDMMLFALRWK